MSTTIDIQVKWNKETLNLQYDPSTGYVGLTELLKAQTNVPLDRMKLMAKAPKGCLWKGVLKADTVVDWSKAVKKGKIQLLLMGSAVAAPVAPTTKPVFLEDLPPEQKAAVVEPAGLQNLGNTCYLNSVVQCWRAIPELRRGLQQPPGNAAGTAPSIQSLLLQALSKTLEQLDRQSTAVSPFPLVQASKAAFPQFASTGPNGQPQQQDAEEFYSSVLAAAAAELATPQHLTAAFPNDTGTEFSSFKKKNVIDALFGIELKETLTCDEVPSDAPTPEPPVVSYDVARKLTCNIQGGGAAAGSTTNVSHVAEGIRLALTGPAEKHSAVLNRNAAWTRTQQLHQLPPILTLQFGRFYWKATPESQDHAGVKCKIMKPVTFQATLDVYDFCTPDVQATLQKARQKAAAAEEDRVTKKLKGELSTEDGGGAEEKKTAAASETTAAAVPMETEEEDDADALQAAVKMSMQDEQDNAVIPSMAPGLPADFQGLYELFAVVTHKGRDADGGHYMAWVKAPHQSTGTEKKKSSSTDDSIENEDWYVYDDDEVSPCQTEDILKLKGGGDWHMSYLNFYRAKK